jgi:hypothetical protein
MLAAVVCAMLCGSRGYYGIAQWLHAQDLELWHALGFTRIPPKLGAFRKLLMRLSIEAFEEAVPAGSSNSCPDKSTRPS